MLSTQVILQTSIALVTGAVGVVLVHLAVRRSGRPAMSLAPLWAVVGGLPALVIGFATMERLGGGGGAVIGKGLIAASAAAGFLASVALNRITGSLRTAAATGIAAPVAALASAGVEVAWKSLNLGGIPRWALEAALTCTAGGMFLVASGVVLRLWAKQERVDNVYKYDHCVFCRYDVSGVRSHLCPECGRQHHARRQSTLPGPNGTQGV